MNFKVWCSIIGLLIVPVSLFGSKNIEVGLVNWSRDLDKAYSESHSTGKPVLVLFQEVPGCSGCKIFGRDVLSHPLLVEAIESEFHPVLVYNNRAGPDVELLKKFNEPAWNYQVIRFLDSKGRDIIPRKDKVWTLNAVVKRMVDVLNLLERPIPKYLDALLAETSLNNYAKAAFSMYCFWTGEMEIGRVEGVLRTEAGWFEGREVTLVTYDKSIISLQELADNAKKSKCANTVSASKHDLKNVVGFQTSELNSSYRKAKASDQKKQLSRWKTIPHLTKIQSTKLNAFITKSKEKALECLSPRQRAYLLNK